MDGVFYNAIKQETINFKRRCFISNKIINTPIRSNLCDLQSHPE